MPVAAVLTRTGEREHSVTLARILPLHLPRPLVQHLLAPPRSGETPQGTTSPRCNQPAHARQHTRVSSLSDRQHGVCADFQQGQASSVGVSEDSPLRQLRSYTCKYPTTCLSTEHVLFWGAGRRCIQIRIQVRSIQATAAVASRIMATYRPGTWGSAC